MSSLQNASIELVPGTNPWIFLAWAFSNSRTERSRSGATISTLQPTEPGWRERARFGVTAVYFPGSKRRNRALLVTTKRLDRAIAMAAMLGSRRMPLPPQGTSRPAASGTAARLYPNAQKRFWRIVRSVRRLSTMASATAERSCWTSTTSAASIAHVRFGSQRSDRAPGGIRAGLDRRGRRRA